MPIPVTTQKSLEGGSISKEDIIQLTERYKIHTGKRRDSQGNFQPFNNEIDTRSCWFSLKEILQFLIDNKVNITDTANLPKYGIRIYPGFHHPDNRYQPIPYNNTRIDQYHFHDTFILVVTENERDLLDEGNHSISLAPFGFDNAKICPPECPQ